MTSYHDEVELEDFEYDESDGLYFYPCPCGDEFQISREELLAGEEEATCPSCSLVIKVVYDKDEFREKYGPRLEERDLDDFEFDEDAEVYSFPCACSERYQVAKVDVLKGKDEAQCSSCEQALRIVYDRDGLSAKFEELLQIKGKEAVKQTS